MLQEWTWPYLQENYTGPYLSDGRLQASVANGKSKPNSRLDKLSREHDTAYALCRSEGCLREADLAYYKATRTMSLFPRIAGDLVLYFNDPKRLFMVEDVVLKRGAKMGNENGRERASRLRRESRQVNGKDIIFPSSTVLLPNQAGVYTPEGDVVPVTRTVEGQNFKKSIAQDHSRWSVDHLEYGNIVSDTVARRMAKHRGRRRRL